ncbi:YdeI/OmpD-associated family protein [Gramella sp. AN32]|uniref:YdeI family protein n=1 Tax=Christiangramia antarctica TaxID=2058158 RepID=A0ABW5X6V3_9FLAO|nr:YdeI/OmpD-associated family protein [Gramella sp. AN32]MCM4157674.1 hypothetical protein [Gramella sp. AN32]
MAIKTPEEYLSKHTYWENELRGLHEMILSTGLKASIKWSTLVYTLNGKNVVGLGAHKNHGGIMFFNGALLKENTTLLVNAQEGKTKAMRQIKFTKDEPIDPEKVRPYILEATQNQREGKVIKSTIKVIIPKELNSELKKDTDLQKSFEGLSPGKQRDYADYISHAKREETKQKRLEKILPMIRAGMGLNDKYKNC